MTAPCAVRMVTAWTNPLEDLGNTAVCDPFDELLKDLDRMTADTLGALSGVADKHTPVMEVKDRLPRRQRRENNPAKSANLSRVHFSRCAVSLLAQNYPKCAAILRTVAARPITIAAIEMIRVVKSGLMVSPCLAPLGAVVL